MMKPIQSAQVAAAAALAAMLAPPLYAYITDPRYHTSEEIWERIFFLQDSLPDLVRVDSIGYSQQDHLPIYAVLISDSARRENSLKPAVVINGQVHAEEVLGVEYAMALIEKAVGSVGNVRRWRRFVDLWVIPTANPEGLNVVHTLDYTYRKNKRDTIGDGLFRWHPGWGKDTSGVDLNRNFPFLWLGGDGFLKQGRQESYDYYRGPAPLSEAEARAMDALAERVRPIYAVVLHSSRTGNYAERVIYPWEFGVNQQRKNPPDSIMIKTVAYGVATRCQRYTGDGTYLAVPVTTPVGDSEIYFYWKYGALSYRIEIGKEAEGMQPDSAGIERVIAQVSPGLEYFLNSAAGIAQDNQGAIETNRLFIQTIDDAGNPLEARLMLVSRSTPLVPYRLTNPRNGVMHWVVEAGFRDTLVVSRFGYGTRVMLVDSESNPRRPLQVALTPLPRRSVTFIAVTPDGIPIEDQLELEISSRWAPTAFGHGASGVPAPPRVLPEWMPPDTAWTARMTGVLSLDLPEGGYRVTVLGGMKYVPRRLEVTVDSARTFAVVLSPAKVLLAQNFDGGDVVFTSDHIKNLYGADSLARWELAGDVFHSPPRSLTDSRLGLTHIFEDTWCAPYNALDDGFDLRNAGTAALVYWINQSLEPGYDSCWVEASFGGAPGTSPDQWEWNQITPAHQDLSLLENVPDDWPWNAAPFNFQRYAPWKRFVVPLDSLCGRGRVHLRFRLKTDAGPEPGGVFTDGVYIDDVMVLSSGSAPPAVSSEPVLPRRLHLGVPRPNPANARAEVAVAMPRAGRLELAVWDLQGRRVATAFAGELPAGASRLAVDLADLPSGLFILSAHGAGQNVVRKIAVMK